MDVLQNLKRLDKNDSYNNSYLLAWINQSWPVFDYHLVHRDLPTTPHVVCLDDEIFEFSNIHLPLDKKTLPDFVCDPRHIYICKIKWVSDYLSQQGCKNILFPWAMIIEQCISMHLLKDNLMVNYPVSLQGAYFCLNRCDRPHRKLFVEYLNEKFLLPNGKVTYRENPPKVDNIYFGDDMSHWNTDDGVGLERHTEKLNQVYVGPVVNNFIKVNDHYPQPVNISIETGTYDFFPTEKSMMAFATKRLPLIYAGTGRIQELKNQGFDLFDSILDHSYDTITEWDKRGKHLIDVNYDILSNTIDISDKIRQTLDYNYNYLINEWLDKTLGNLQQNIEELI